MTLQEYRDELYILNRIIAWLDKNEKPQYPTSRDDIKGGYKELKNLAMMQRMEYEDKSRQFLKEGK